MPNEQVRDTAREIAEQIESESATPAAEPGKLTVVLAIGPGATAGQIECWREHFESSGTTLPLAVIATPGGAGFGGFDADVYHADIEVEDGPSQVDLTELVMAQAFSAVGPCLVLRPEALPVGPLDAAAELEGDFLMATDPARRKHDMCREELAGGALLTRVDLFQKFTHWWRLTRARVAEEGDTRPGRIHPGNFGQVLLSIIFHEMHPIEFEPQLGMTPDAMRESLDKAAAQQPRLPDEWCYSRTYPVKPVNVLWVHGAPSLQLKHGWRGQGGFYSDPD